MTHRRGIVRLLVLPLGLLAACACGRITLATGDDDVDGGAADAAPLVDAAAGDFTLALGMGTVTCPQGGGTMVTVQVDRGSGFTAPIDVSLTGSAPAISATPITIPSGSRNGSLPITCGRLATTGSHAMTVEARGGPTRHTAPLDVQVQPSAGGLDPGFGGGTGFLSIDFAGLDDTPNALAIDSSGRIVVAGTAKSSTDGRLQLAVARVAPAGMLDATFDGDGRAMIPVGVGDAVARGVALSTDGKIVLVGSAFPTAANEDVALVRLGGTGALDTSFDGDGIKLQDLGGANESGDDVAITSSGFIVVAGWSRTGTTVRHAVARFRASGLIDGGWGAGMTGMVLDNFSAGGGALGHALELVPGDAIVTAGVIGFNVGATRYTAGGFLDGANFSNGGQNSYVVGGGVSEGFALALDGTDLVIAGVAHDPGGATAGDDMAVVKLDSMGRFHPAFVGGSGRWTSGRMDADAAVAVAVDGMHRILVAGAVGDAGGAPKAAVVRLLENGDLDTTFGDAGLSVVPFAAINSRATGIAVQSDGKIIVTGVAIVGSADFIVARLVP